MFTAKTKRNYRAVILSVVILLLCVLIAVLLWPSKPVEQADTDPQPGLLTSQNPSLWTEEDAPDDETDEKPDDEPDDGEDFAEKNNISADERSYYEVKRSGSQIAVFFCDGDGNMVQLETTGILYELLSPSDQQLFDQGIRVEGQEELAVLLQDFEG